MIPKSIFDTVQAIKSSPAPVLFCDTCSLLDLIRLPIRETSPVNIKTILTSVCSILSLSQKGEIYLVLPSLVIKEWTKHARKIQQTTQSHFDMLKSQNMVTSTIALHSGQTHNADDISILHLPDYLYSLSNEFLQSSIELTEDTILIAQASRRTVSNTAPARKGKEHKDCIIYVHTLRCMQKLREDKIDQPLAFLTSNINDYCEITGSPKEPIDKELTTIGAVLTTNWQWALHEILKN